MTSATRYDAASGSVVNWLLPDLHGDAAGSLSADGSTVTSATRYDAWGDTVATGTAGGTPVGNSAWKYQGRLDISPSALATPLYAMGARLYSPGIGAFTSLDTSSGSAQDPLSMNRFLYAAANPATLVDPTGHDFCTQIAPGVYVGCAGSSSAQSLSQLRAHEAGTQYKSSQAAKIGFATKQASSFNADMRKIGQMKQAQQDDARESRAQSSVSQSFTGYGCSTVRCQVKDECLAAPPSPGRDCFSYDWSQENGLDAPATDATPWDLSPVGLAVDVGKAAKVPAGWVSTVTGTAALGAGLVGLAGTPELWGIPVDGAALVLGSVSLGTGIVATIGDCSTGEVTCGMDAIGTATGLGGPIARGAAGAGYIAHDVAEGSGVMGDWIGTALGWAGSAVSAFGN